MIALDCCRGLQISKQQEQMSTSAPLVSLLYPMLCEIYGSVLIRENPGSEFPQNLDDRDFWRVKGLVILAIWQVTWHGLRRTAPLCSCFALCRRVCRLKTPSILFGVLSHSSNYGHFKIVGAFISGCAGQAPNAVCFRESQHS